MEEFDFSGIESATGESKILKPGEYQVTRIESELKTPEGKNAYLDVSFYNKENKVSRKFYITAKALNILQYVNETLTDKKITRAFKTAQEVSNWFDSIFKGYNAGKTNQVSIVVGREIAADGKVYSRVKDFGFLTPIEKGTEFESKEYTEEELQIAGTRLTRLNNYQGETAPGGMTMLGSEPSVPKYQPEPEMAGSDDLPF